jgi:pimeloyl-ACP methyl ester carboxylesterase
MNIIKFDRFEIPYRVHGDTGPFIICVNGVQQTMAVWRSFIKHFSKNYKVIVFDFPGQGRAKIISGGSGVSIDEQVEILHEVIDKLAGCSYDMK